MTGIGYSAINTARSALSTILVDKHGITIGQYASVKRLLKGVFELRTPMPKYDAIWDVDIVLDYLRIFFPPSDLPLSHLTYKVAMLLALVSAQRVQTLKSIDIRHIIFYDDIINIPIYDILKTTSVRNRKFTIELPVYNEDQRVCVKLHLEEYLKRTALLRGKYTKLFISINIPHKPVTSETLSRWLKTVLREAGIDTNIFKGHSTRAAASSNLFRKDEKIEAIMGRAGWKNCETFFKFYYKPIGNN